MSLGMDLRGHKYKPLEGRPFYKQPRGPCKFAYYDNLNYRTFAYSIGTKSQIANYRNKKKVDTLTSGSYEQIIYKPRHPNERDSLRNLKGDWSCAHFLTIGNAALRIIG